MGVGLRQPDYGPQRAVDCDVNLLHVWASAPDRGTVISCREYQGLCGDPQCFGRGSPGCTSKTTDECDSGCNSSCHFFNVLLEVQHPVQAHAKVLWSLLKHQAFVIDKHVQFPFSFSVVTSLNHFNINLLTIMIACVHIMDVIIFQKIIACIYLLSRRLCMLCLLSRLGGRGKGSKYTCSLECIYFTTFDCLHGAYHTAVTEPHECVQRKTLLVLRSQTRHMSSVFWVF